jgi:RNA polymerase subunit RPABC4/transcription elongation factor Spt4
MVGYKKPCRHCGELVDSDANICPWCSKASPTDSPRCPKCRSPIAEGQKVCSNCGLELKMVCPRCGKTTFLGDHCDGCGARLMAKCPKCGAEQPPNGVRCVGCNKKIKGGWKI